MRSMVKSLFLLGALVCLPARGHEVLVVAFDSNSVPTMYAGPDGDARGIYPAIVRAAFDRMGVPVRTVALPFRRGVQGLARGEMAVGSLLRTPERERIARFSRPFFVERVSVFTRAGFDHHFGSLRDLDGKRVGVLRGWAYGADFDRARAAGRFEVAEVDTDMRNFMKLNLGRIDYAVATTLSGELMVSRPEFSSIRMAPRDLVSAPIHLAINKRSRHAALIERFDSAIADMRRAGEIDAIVAAEMQRARDMAPRR